jgi:hypothetical protein
MSQLLRVIMKQVLVGISTVKEVLQKEVYVVNMLMEHNVKIRTTLLPWE